MFPKHPATQHHVSMHLVLTAYQRPQWDQFYLESFELLLSVSLPWRSYLHYKQSFSLEHLECLRDSCSRVCWSCFIFHLWALSYENDPVKSTMHVTWFTNQILHSSWKSWDIDTSKAEFSPALSMWVFRSWDNKQKLPVFFPVRRKNWHLNFLQDSLIPLSQSNVRKPWPVF